ncbi:MAG: SMC-Scp complex subunit ScpB [Deltaproteobacteria bacterium]|nr:SMC-Scp complex subunit ScpB [Deltaproteobacteria bacterium]
MEPDSIESDEVETANVEADADTEELSAKEDADEDVVRVSSEEDSLSEEELTERRQILESLILTAEEPISAQKLSKILPDGSVALVNRLVGELNASYCERSAAFEIARVAGGYQLRTLSAMAPYLAKLKEARPLRLSRAALETLAIVAYRQPVTRAEIEQIRGVDAGAVLRTMMDRKLVRIAGHRDVPGRPIIYATTKRFLEIFSIHNLKDLPSLRDLKEIAGEQEELSLEPQTLDEVLASAEAQAEGETGIETGADVAVELQSDLDLVGQPNIDGNPSGELH